jgi:diguanylate cyclase
VGYGAHGRRRIEPEPPAGSPGSSSWLLPGLLLGALVVVAALIPARYGLTGRPWTAFRDGLFLSGGLAVTTGLVLLIWWLMVRRRRSVEISRLLLSLAVLCWGTGQLCLAFDSVDHVVAYPALGDLIGSGAAPISLLGLVFQPRRSITSWSGVRLGLDSVVLGSALTFVLWRLLLVKPEGVLDGRHANSGIFVLADCVVFSGVLLITVRDVRSRLWPAVLGVLCHVIADLGSMLAADQHAVRLDPWLSMSLWCLALPLVGVGIVRFRSSSPHGGEELQDRREAAATQVATVLTYSALLLALLVGIRIDTLNAVARGSLLLALLIVTVMWVREMISTRLRLRLTAGLRAQANRDSLTGLPNRRALTKRVAELENGDTAWVVLTLDLDGFKQVNDLLGHHAGDDLLVGVADALQRICPPGASIARIGGDEFAMLSPGDLEEGRQLAERLRLAIGEALELKAPGVGTSASVGVGRLVRRAPADTPVRSESEAEAALAGRHRDQLAGLVESAAALRAAKESGRDAVQVYAGEVAQARERRLLLEFRLRRAIENRSIVTHGQPIVDLATGRLTGFESLARWSDDEIGMVAPDEFIAVAEQTGMVVALGEHLLEETLEAATAAGVFAAGLTLSINASPIQLRVPGFAELMRYHLNRCRVRPAHVIVEITEAILVAEGDLAVSTLAELHELGIGLAIDDFGTGYSALGYLRRLPVQVIKIDKSLTSSLLTEPKTVAIVEGVVRMAHRMGVRVVMEGIEDEEEADSCRAVGADSGQGWLFGRPTPWDKAAELVAQLPAATPVPVPAQRHPPHPARHPATPPLHP